MSYRAIHHHTPTNPERPLCNSPGLAPRWATEPAAVTCRRCIQILTRADLVNAILNWHDDRRTEDVDTLAHAVHAYHLLDRASELMPDA